MDVNVTFPSQRLPYKSKGKKWREQCVDFAATRTYFNYSPVRKSIVAMKINYDLLNGIIHMDDVARVINPDNLSMAFLPEKIQHYPIINSKINTLVGEEGARKFEWRAIVTNPNSVSQIEEEKRRLMDNIMQNVVENTSIDDARAEQEMSDGLDYVNFTYQARRELQANELLKHYSKQYNFKQMFNNGVIDIAAAGMEAYHVCITGGEPYVYKMNPMKIRALQTGYSDKLEDADMIIYEDYWTRSKIIDTYYDDLSDKQVKWLSDETVDFGGKGNVGAAGNYDETREFIPASAFFGDEGIAVRGDYGSGFFDSLAAMDGGLGSDLLPYDVFGNIRVIRVWWKSLRKILRVKSFDPETGEEVFDFYPETYIPDEAAGEEAVPLWVNQAWEGTKIGEDIYVGIRPCLVQRNSISNPSRCDFGIIGTIYNINEAKPFTLIDMMRPYSYAYDAIHAKLVELIATNWGKLVVFDLALKPKNWEVEKWLYFARKNKTLIKDSFREGDKGAATGKLAGGLNNASSGYVDADWGESIQHYMNMLQWVKDSMSDLVGINRQREGNTYSRETVGGIERAVLQSSYITDWIFQKHDDTKRRVLDCFIDYAKASLRGRSKKFSYILSDGSQKIMEIDGDEFASSDYGILMDNSEDTLKLEQNIDQIAQAALQTQVLDFASILKLYSSASTQEKVKVVESAQRRMEQRAQQQQQQQMQLEQQKIQADQQMKMQEMQQKDMLNQRDNDTRIKMAEINAQAEYLRLGIYEDQNNEQLRREEMDIDREKLHNEILALDKEFRFKEKELAVKKELEEKKIAVQKQKSNTTKKSS